MSDRKNNTQQTQGALRLMEALSGIDEELLERSGATGSHETAAQNDGSDEVTSVSENRKRRRSGIVYRNAVAACLGLVVVGALSWNALRPIWTPKGAGSSSSGSAGGQEEMAENQSAYDVETQSEDGPVVAAEDTAGGLGTEEVTGDITENLIEDLETGGRDGGGAESNLTDSEREVDRLESSSVEDSGKQQEKDEELMSTASPKMELTEAEARNTAVVGAFIPDDIPKGYTFESAYLDGQGTVTVIWHHGTDSILINVSQVVPEDIETFLNPIFLWEDMSLEIVNSRMKSVGDAGDTDTPRGNFSVLYPEGVLLYFNGRGTAEEIWDMLNSAGK